MEADRLSGFFWLIFGFLCMYASSQLDLGSFREPGPGFFPFMAGCFFSLLALLIVISSFIPGRGQKSKISSLWKEANWRRPLIAGLLILSYILMLEKMGFLPTSLILLFLMLRWVEKFSWWKALLISASASACTYLLFHTLLKATLPIGILGI
jgi:putative tricarboxylic transport membrane protein